MPNFMQVLSFPWSAPAESADGADDEASDPEEGLELISELLMEMGTVLCLW